MASGGASPALSIRSETPDLPNSTPHGLSKLSNVLSNTTNVPNSSPPKIKICVFLGASPGNSPAQMVTSDPAQHHPNKTNRD